MERPPNAIETAGKKVILFTDLDGTLLDFHTYSYREAEEGIRLLMSKGIPLLFCSAKTRAEQEHYQKKLGLSDPFVVENGGAIFVRRGTFSQPFPFQKTVGPYSVIELGLPYDRIREALGQVRDETRIRFRGYGDMDVEEVGALTGLGPEEARRAMMREYVETVRFESPETDLPVFRRAVAAKGLQVTFGGRFLSVMGPNDKGRAAQVLAELYRREFGPVLSVGIGDNRNDLPLLSSVDVPILVRKPGGGWEDLDLPSIVRADGIGPAGWNDAVLRLFSGKKHP